MATRQSSLDRSALPPRLRAPASAGGDSTPAAARRRSNSADSASDCGTHTCGADAELLARVCLSDRCLRGSARQAGDVILWHNFMVRQGFALDPCTPKSIPCPTLCAPPLHFLHTILRRHRIDQRRRVCGPTQVHGSSSNVQRHHPRLGVFSRWHHTDMFIADERIEPPDFEVIARDSPHS